MPANGDAHSCKAEPTSAENPEVAAPMPALDTWYYPHILDLILDFAPHEAIPCLRLTARHVRAHVDRRIAQHVVYVLCSQEIYTAVGHIRLNFADKDVAARARVLDLRKGSRSLKVKLQAPSPEVRFPNVWCARVFDEESSIVLDYIAHRDESAPPLQTIIYGMTTTEVTCGDISSLRGLVGSTGACRRQIFLLPQDMSLFYVGYYGLCPPRPESETVILRLPEMDDALRRLGRGYPGPGVSCSPLAHPPFGHERLVRAVGSHVGIQGRKCTVVGIGEADEPLGPGPSWKDLIVYDEHRKAAYLARFGTHCVASADNLEDKLRVLTCDEWRAEVTGEEWNLVASMPGCM